MILYSVFGSPLTVTCASSFRLNGFVIEISSIPSVSVSADAYGMPSSGAEDEEFGFGSLRLSVDSDVVSALCGGSGVVSALCGDSGVVSELCGGSDGFFVVVSIVSDFSEAESPLKPHADILRKR